MHSLTYTQKAAGILPAAEMHMFICVHFSATHKLQRADQRAESKKMHTLYIR